MAGASRYYFTVMAPNGNSNNSHYLLIPASGNSFRVTAASDAVAYAGTKVKQLMVSDDGTTIQLDPPAGKVIQSGDDTPLQFDEDTGTIIVPAGGLVDGETWPAGGTVAKNGTAEKTVIDVASVTLDTFVKEVETSPFSDVSTSAYYYEAVKWAQEKGITGGIGNGLFGPNQPCTRAQIVTFLWRAAGSPEPKAMSSFADVSTDAYYAKAVAWAVENGITTGTGDGKFSPDATCTREQAVAFLYRASGSPAVSGGSAFSDVAANAYYADAVAWAEKNDVTGGIGGDLFGSGNTCTRAQIVTFLYRAYQGK